MRADLQPGAGTLRGGLARIPDVEFAPGSAQHFHVGAPAGRGHTAGRPAGANFLRGNAATARSISTWEKLRARFTPAGRRYTRGYSPGV